MGKITYLYQVDPNDLLDDMKLVDPAYLDELVAKRLDMLLAVLPEGTKIVEIEDLKAIGPTIDQLLTFEHPVFPDGARLWLKFASVPYAGSPDGILRRCELLSEIKYLGPLDTLIS